MSGAPMVTHTTRRHKKVVDQTEGVGHAVRAAYMYSAMADIAALTGDKKDLIAVDKIWDDVANKKDVYHRRHWRHRKWRSF